jgi:hypothetical protein
VKKRDLPLPLQLPGVDAIQSALHGATGPIHGTSAVTPVFRR